MQELLIKNEVTILLVASFFYLFTIVNIALHPGEECF